MKKAERGILHQLLIFPGMVIIWLFDRLVEFSGKDIDMISSSKVPFNHIIEENYLKIKEEFEKVYSLRQLENIDDFYIVDTNIGQDDQWKAFPFIIWNNAFENNMSQCPATKEVLNQIPGCTSAMFSVLLPGKHILPHKGVYKGVFRCLYTIHVSDKVACWIKVNQQKVYFENNKSIYFDETFEHEVKNESEQIRAVLYLDIYRKFPFPLNIYNRVLFFLFSQSPYIQTIVREYNGLNHNSMVKHIPAPEISL